MLVIEMRTGKKIALGTKNTGVQRARELIRWSDHKYTFFITSTMGPQELPEMQEAVILGNGGNTLSIFVIFYHFYVKILGKLYENI